VTDNDYTYTEGMTDGEIEERLREAKTGELGLARDGDACAVPVACHYDGDALLLRPGEHEGGTKMAHLETTDRASLVLCEYTPPDESWSVVVRGRSPDWTFARTRRVRGDAFLPIRIFGEPVDAVEEVLYELETESVTGRRT
jgi:hypothetical protein